MSEHADSAVQPNGAAPVVRSRNGLATSTLEDNVLTIDVVGAGTVSVDITKLHPNSMLEQAGLGARTSLRLSIQKMEDPAKIMSTLQTRVAKMLAGEPTIVIGHRGRTSKKEPDDLTQALANMAGKTIEEFQKVKDDWYNRFFRSEESASDKYPNGCVFKTTSDGKIRIYGKQEALAKLRAFPNVKAELDKIAKASGAKVAPAKNLDLNSFLGAG